MHPWPPCTPGSINQAATHPVTLLASQCAGGHCPFPIQLLPRRGLGRGRGRELVLLCNKRGSHCSKPSAGWHCHTAGHGSAASQVCHMVPHGPCHHLPQLREAQENSASPPICAACLHNSLPGDQVGARPCRVSSRCTGATPGEPGITAGSGAPAALILLRNPGAKVAL